MVRDNYADNNYGLRLGVGRGASRESTMRIRGAIEAFLVLLVVYGLIAWWYW